MCIRDRLYSSSFVAESAKVEGWGLFRMTGRNEVTGTLELEPQVDTSTDATFELAPNANLALYGGGDNRGDYLLGTGANLGLWAGTYVWRADGSIVGEDDGTLHVNGNEVPVDVTMQGVVKTDRTDVGYGATVHVGDGNRLGRVWIAEGTLDLRGLVNASSVKQESGELKGEGHLTVDEGYEWSGGTQSGPGSTEVLGELALVGDGAARGLDDRTVNASSAKAEGTSSIAFTGEAPWLVVDGRFDVAGSTLNLTGTGDVFADDAVVSEGAHLTVEPRYNTYAEDALHVLDEGTVVELKGGGAHLGSVSVADADLVLGGGTTFDESSTLDMPSGYLRTTGPGIRFGGNTVIAHWDNDEGAGVEVDADVVTQQIDNQGAIAVTDQHELAVVGLGAYAQSGEGSSFEPTTANAVLAVESGVVDVDEGTFGGKGSVEGNLVNRHGEVFTGTGQLAVLGTYQQGPDALLTLDVDGANHGLLLATGTATVDSGLELLVTGEAPTEEFAVVHSDEARIGSFTDVTGDTGCFELFYSALNVTAAPQPLSLIHI